MKTKEEVVNYDLAFMRIADQLNLWADEALTGGWSTYQVKPMRDMASNIRRSVVNSDYDDICKK